MHKQIDSSLRFLVIGLFFLFGCSNSLTYSVLPEENYELSSVRSDYNPVEEFSWSLENVEPFMRIRFNFENSSLPTLIDVVGYNTVMTIGVQESGTIIVELEGHTDQIAMSSNGCDLRESAKIDWTYIEQHTTDSVKLDEKFPLLTFHYGHSDQEDCTDDCMILQGEFLEEEPDASEFYSKNGINK